MTNLRLLAHIKFIHQGKLSSVSNVIFILTKRTPYNDSFYGIVS